MKNRLCFIKKGLPLLLILLSLTAYANPVDGDMVRKAAYTFLVGSTPASPDSKGEGSYSTADCVYNLSPASRQVTVDANAGTGQIIVTTTSSCFWTAAVASNAAWITLTSGQSGTGSGSVGYSYTQNTTLSSRTGTITIADQTYTVTQVPQSLAPDGYETNNTAAEAYPFTPAFTQNASTINISPANCHNVDDIDIYKISFSTYDSYTLGGELYDLRNQNNGSNYTLDVLILYSTDNGSNWTEWGDSQLPNLTVQGGVLYLQIASIDPGDVGSYAARIDIKITASANCTYGLSATSQQVTAATGTGQVTVTTTSSCAWAAVVASNAPWITLTSGQSTTTGSGSVAYSYTENTALSSRTGTITIAGQAYTVTQVPQSLTPDGYETNNTAAAAYSFTPVYTQNVSTTNISPANCHTVDDIDFYKISLAAGSSYTVSGALYDLNNQNNGSSYTLDARLFYSTDNGSTWTEWGDSPLSNLTVALLYLKIEPAESGNVGSYAARIEVTITATVGCSYDLSPANKQLTAASGTDQVAVTTGSSCVRTAAVDSNTSWITLTSGQSATGSGSVGYSYTENTVFSSRTGTITIAGQTYTVTQAPPALTPDGYETNNTVAAAYSFTPAFTQNASTINISPANCHTVDDIDIYRIDLAAGSSYTVSGALYDLNNQNNGSSYTLDAQISSSINSGSTWSYPDDRQLSSLTMQGGGILYLKIVPRLQGRVGSYAARIDIAITAAANCTYDLSAASQQAASAAGNSQVTVTTGSSCSWAATVASDASWITLTSGQSSTGTANLTYSYTANTVLSSRTGTITIADQTYTVTQVPQSLTPDGYEGNNTPAAAYSFTPAFTQNASNINISPANCHTVDDIDIYKINFAAGNSYTAAGNFYNYYNQIDNSSYTLNGRISSSTDGATWSAPGDTQVSSRTMQGGETLYLKIESYNQEYVGSYAVSIDITVVCSFALSATSQSVASDAGSNQVDVTTTSLCSWTSSPNAPWITLTAAPSATGSGRVSYSYTQNTGASPRTGTITIAGQTYTVTQAAAPACSLTLASTSANVTSPSGINSVNVTANLSNCPWTATSNASWITIRTGQSGTGSGSVVYAYTENMVMSSRAGTITIAGQTYTVTQAAAPACSLTLAATSASVTSPAGAAGVYVSSSRSDCQWTAVSNAAWITLTSGQSTTGSGNVGYSYTENMVMSSRAGTITIAGQTYTVTQGSAPPCSFTLASSSASVTSPSGTGNVSVTANRSNCTWTAATNAAWITVTSGQSSTGSGSAGYSYAENMVMSSRVGTIIVASQTYTVTQAAAPACTFALVSTSASVTSASGTGSANVTTNRSNCTWTAATNTAWITLTSGQNSTGSGSVGYSYTENTTLSSRTGTIVVAGQSYTVTQDVPPCSFTLASGSANVTSASGSGSVDVTASRTDCQWTAATTAGWITLTSGQSTTGSGNVSYFYAENTGTVSRTGTITIANQPYTVTQAAPPPCSFTFASNSANVTSVSGTGNVTVTASRTNCQWTAAVTDAWITLTSGQNTTTGSGNVAYSYTENTGTSSRTGTITIAGAGQPYTVTQAAAAACTFTLPSNAAHVPSASGTGSVAVTASRSDCQWTAAKTVAWITLTATTGSGNVGYTYTENTDTSPRTGAITISGQNYSVTQGAAATACSFTFASGSANVTSASGTGNVGVTASSGACAWTAASNATWITLTSGQSTTGSGSVGYSYTENVLTSPRTGTIAIAGTSQTYSVTQAAPVPCSFTLASSSANVTSASGTGSVNVTASRTNCTWTAATIAAWITLTSGQNTTGSGSLGYSYTENTGAASRTGVITMAGQSYTVMQGAISCTYSLTKSSVEVAGESSTGTVGVTTQASCSWTAVPNAAWITVTPDVGEGSTEVTYSLAKNTGVARTGTVTVAGQTFTVSQSVVTGFETAGPIKIFPNPAREYVRLELPSTDKNYVSLKIANVFGQILYKLENPNRTEQIPLTGFTSGLYFIILQGEEKAVVQKLVVE